MHSAGSKPPRLTTSVTDRPGFTLVEVLVALGIIVAAVLPLSMMMSQGTRGVDFAGRRLLLGQLASLLIADLHVRAPATVVERDWASILSDTDPTSPFSHFANLSDDASGMVGLDDPLFGSLHSRLATITYRLDVLEDQPAPGLKTCTVTMREVVGTRVVSFPVTTVLDGGV